MEPQDGARPEEAHSDDFRMYEYKDSELRKPEEDPALLAAQLQAESIASTDSYQQILAEAAIEAGEVPQGTQGTPQLNLALLQALLRSGGMERQQEPDDSQERLRVLQLQALLATLQMRVSQAAPQRAPPPGDSLGHLDTGALGRLLAANQAHVQQQAEQDILHRNSLDAARRNSFCADVDAQRQEMQYPYTGAYTGGADYMTPGEQWSREAAESSRRFSVDASGGSGLPLHLQGMDPRILAALSTQRQNAAQMAFAQAQAQNEAAEQGLRRSVDMGSLAHTANMRHGANTASKQGAPHSGMPQPGPPPPPQGSMDMAALSNAFARSNLMEAQASGQLPPRQEMGGLHSKRTSRDYSRMESQASDLRRQYDAFSSQASSQLQAQLSSQLGSMGQSLGSLPLSSLGSILGQPVSRMSSYGPQHSASQDSSSRRISFESLSQFSPGTHSAASSSSRNRGLTEQQAQLLRQLQAEEEQERRGAELSYTLSGGSTPSNAPPTPGRTPQQYVMPGMASPRVSFNAESHLQGMPLQAAMGPPLKPSRSTPVIPEEGPAPSIADFPRSSLDAARMMPTLLEQLKVFEAQRRVGEPREVHSARPIKRNSSFESLSADLPRSISDLNLAEHASSSGIPQHQGHF